SVQLWRRRTSVPFSEFVQRWWPLPASLDLVRGPADVVASAVLAEVTRFVDGEPLSARWVSFDSPAGGFASVDVFPTVPIVYFVMPTWSEWSVLWNNSFLCDGYDSLCWCLTSRHGLPTVHWKSSDADAVFQAGSLFTARRRVGGDMVERSVYC